MEIDIVVLEDFYCTDWVVDSLGILGKEVIIFELVICSYLCKNLYIVL